jgi:hypothetical protein
MTEDTSKPKVLTSDPNVLHKIKFIQFRTQLIPLIAVIFFMVINIVIPQLPNKIVLYLTIACFGWYLVERILFRTKNKILVPEEGVFVSPIDGKVLSIHTVLDTTTLTLKKSFLDVVELRLPFPEMHTEIIDSWNFDTALGLISLKIKAKKVHYFENNNIHGSVIGVLPGNAIITIKLPANIKVLVKENQNLFGGESELFSLSEDAEVIPVRKSILVEETLDENI